MFPNPMIKGHDLYSIGGLQIGDFGMTRALANETYQSHRGKVPLKWTAPEVTTFN